MGPWPFEEQTREAGTMGLTPASHNLARTITHSTTHQWKCHRWFLCSPGSGLQFHRHDAGSYGNAGGWFSCTARSQLTHSICTSRHCWAPPKNLPSRIALRQRWWRKYRSHRDCVDCEQWMVQIQLSEYTIPLSVLVSQKIGSPLLFFSNMVKWTFFSFWIHAFDISWFFLVYLRRSHGLGTRRKKSRLDKRP